MTSALRAWLQIRLSLATWLVVVSVLAWLPMLVFTSIMIYRQVVEQHVLEQAAMGRRAQVAAAAIGHHLDSAIIELMSVARADSLMSGDMVAMHAFAQRVVQVDARVRSISLIDARGSQIFNTLEPLGDPVPPLPAAELPVASFAGVLRKVSPLVPDAVAGGPAIVVSVPVEVQGRPSYALGAALNLDEIGERLADQALPAHLTAAVLDQNLVIIAGSGNVQQVVGQPAIESLSEGIRSSAAQFVARTEDGVEMIVSAAQVPGSGWVVAVGQPVATLKAEVRQSLALVFAAGLASAVFGVVLATTVARLLGGQLRGVIAAAEDPGLLDAAPDSRVTEVSYLAAALRRARRDQDEATDELHRARRDALTGLPGRAQFLATAGDRLADAAGRTDLDVGLLFIDLDGFKQTNDRLSHDAGDRILQKVAAALCACIRAEDVVGRLGGDEFAVLLVAPRLQAPDIACTLAQRIVQTVSAFGNGIGCCIGVAIAHPGEDLDATIRRADQAMLGGKRAGKGRVVVAT